MFCFVPGYGRRQTWLIMVWPTRWTPFPFRRVHAWLVQCWPACVWSVDGHVAAAAAVCLVRGCLGCLMVGLFAVGSLALQRALVRSDVVVVMPVSVLVGNASVALGRHGTFRLCAASPSWGRNVATVGMTAGKSFQIWYDTPCPALEAALHAQPIIWYFAVPFGCPLSFARAIHMYTPVGGKALSVPLVASPCSPWEPQGAAPARWCGARVRVCLPVVCRIVPCLAGYVAGVSVPQCGV